MPLKPVDKYVGQRLRQRRDVMGVSQIKMGEILDVSFQQVQKYERGINRVSASTLYEAARALKAPIGYFFDGFQGEGEGLAEEAEALETAADFWRSSEGRILSSTFLKITDAKVRAQVLGVLAAIAKD